MNTRQLNCALNSDPVMRNYNWGVYSIDQFLNQKLVDNAVYVCNEQPSWMPGSHWFLILIKDSEIFYVDSFARSMEFYGIDEKIKSLCAPVFFLNDALQSVSSTVCGEYCLFFIFNLCRGRSLHEISNFFSSDVKVNDEKVRDFIWKTFPGHERGEDKEQTFWYNQVKL